MVASAAPSPARVWKNVYGPLLALGLRDHLHKVNIPARLIWSGQDYVTSSGDRADFLQALPRAELSGYAVASHAVRWEEAEHVTAEINTFVAATVR